MSVYRVDASGKVFRDNSFVGTFYASGDVEDSQSQLLGEVDINGDAWNMVREHLGWADSDTKIYDKRHFHIANILDNGDIIDIGSSPVGKVAISVHKSFEKPNQRPMYFRAAAAAVLFFGYKPII